MASIIITSQPVSLTAVPGQNSTFSVTASADFSPATFNYQWSVNASPITGANASSYTIDPLIGNNGDSFSVVVSALSAGVLQATVPSNPATLTVIEDTPPFNTFDVGAETGRQRHLRLRLLGYI